MSGNKAVVVSKFDLANPTSGITIQDLAIPTPGPNEVVVRVTLRPVNPADIFSLMGVYPGFQPAEGVTPVAGLEGMGTVHAVGEGVTKFTPGQRVTGTPFDTVETGTGTWQQYILAKQDHLVAVPDTVSDEAACQFFVNPVTVVGMLRILNIPVGEYLLQTGAGSVLGRQMIQVCKHRGIKTINVVRRAALADELKALGGDEVIVSTEEDVTARVMEITGGKGAYGAVECVGGDLFASVASSVRVGGTAIIYGAMSGLTAGFNIPDPLFRAVTIRGFWLITWMKEMGRDAFEGVVSEVMQLLSDKIITPYSGEKFALENAVEAVAKSVETARGGKVFLEG